MNERGLLLTLHQRIATLTASLNATNDWTGRSAIMGAFGGLGVLVGISISIAFVKLTDLETYSLLLGIVTAPTFSAIGLIAGQALWRRARRGLAAGESIVDRRDFAFVKLDEEVKAIRTLGLDSHATARLVRRAQRSCERELRRINGEERGTHPNGSAKPRERIRIALRANDQGPTDTPPPEDNPASRP